MYLYNSILLDEIEELQQIDKGICNNLFRTLLKSRDGFITEKKLRRLMLFQIVPLQNRVERDSASYIRKLKAMTAKNHPGNEEVGTKAARHARRFLWLSGIESAPNRLKQ